MVIPIILEGTLGRFPMLIRHGLTVVGALLVTVHGIAWGQVDRLSTGERSMTAQHQRQIVIGKREIPTELDWVYRVAWSPDSKHFAVIGSKGSGDHTIYSVLVYDAKTEKVITALPIKQPGSITGDIAFSPDGKYLAAGIGIITVWDAQVWKWVRDFEGPYARGFVGGSVECMAFNPDSKSIAVLYRSVVWPETLEIRTREEAAAWGQKEAASKKDHTFWEKRAKGEILKRFSTIMAFSVETAQRVFVQRGPDITPDGGGHFTANIAYTSDGQYLVVSRVEHLAETKLKQKTPNRTNSFLELRDSQTGQLVREIPGTHVMEITASAISPDGKLAATGTTTGTRESSVSQPLIDNKDPLRLWNLDTGEKVMEYGPLRGRVMALVFSPDGQLLISCQRDIEKKETMWFWDVASGQLLERVRTPLSGRDFFSCAISPNGRMVAMPVIGHIYLMSLQQ